MNLYRLCMFCLKDSLMPPPCNCCDKCWKKVRELYDNATTKDKEASESA